MVVGILLIILSILNLILLPFGLFLLFTPFYYYSIAIFFINMVMYLLIAIIFFEYTKKYIKKEDNVLRSFKLSKCIIKENGIKVIEFMMNNNECICKKNDSIRFTLGNYLFKKSFIIARIIREVRYSTVSNQLYLSKLLNFKLKINSVENLVVRFIDDKKIKEYILVKNYVSNSTVLSKAISKSKFYQLSYRSYCEYFKKIEKINENIYLNW